MDDLADQEIDRLRAERDNAVAHNATLEQLLWEQRQAVAALNVERDRLITQRVQFLDRLSERAAALQAALNIEGARLLMAVVKDLADG